MKQHVSLYRNGLNKDVSFDSLPKEFYIDALDMRITTSTGESSASITNIAGTALSFTIDQGDATGTTTKEIIGATSIRDSIVLFVTDSHDVDGGTGWIYELTYDYKTLASNLSLLYMDAGLLFSKLHPIEAHGRFENDCVERVYFSDHQQPLRSVNIRDAALASATPGIIDVFPDVDYTQPLLDNIAFGGSLVVGVYQYAYRLVTSDGKQTLISPPSNLIYLTSDPESEGASHRFMGDPKGTISGKSIKIKIDLATLGNYKEIQLISIVREDLEGVPVISLVETKSIAPAATSISFVHSGSELTSIITPFEYATKEHPFRTVKSMAEKDAALIVANTKATLFDIDDVLAELGETFDSKSYRYNNVPTASTNEFNPEYNQDAIWNAAYHTNANQFKYQSDGATLGGEGANVDFKFVLEEIELSADIPAENSFVFNPGPTTAPDLNDDYTYTSKSFKAFDSPYINGLLKGYKRGEIYRFGIVFYNLKGEASFVKHIADIKMPEISDVDSAVNASGTTSFPISRTSGNTAKGYALGVQFNVTLPTQFKDTISGYQIVRVRRESFDKTRFSSGIMDVFVQPANIAGSGYEAPDDSVDGLYLLDNGLDLAGVPICTLNNARGFVSGGVPPAAGTIFGDFVKFMSPELSYNLNSHFNANTKGYLVKTSVFDFDTANTREDNAAAEDWRVKLRNNVPLTAISNDNIREVKNQDLGSGVVGSQTWFGKYNSTPTAYFARNYALGKFDLLSSPATVTRPRRGGTGMLSNMEKVLTDPATGGAADTPPAVDFFDGTNIPGDPDAQTYLVDYKVFLAEQYGGNTTEILEQNIFIPASPILQVAGAIDTSGQDVDVFGGDIYITMYVSQVTMVDINFTYASVNDKVSHTITVPMETTVNVDLAYGATTATGVQFDNDGLDRQETGNNVTNFAKDLDMYAHNPVYSQENTDVIFVTRPLSQLDCQDNDIIAYISDNKINGETVDSWSTFRVNNNYDQINGSLGPINRLLNFKDNVYFLQDKGFGIYSINPRVTVSTSDGIPTELGSGQGFQDHTYYSTENGCIHQYGALTTDNAIIFFDAINKKHFKFSGQVLPFSDIKGLHGFFKDTLKGRILNTKEQGGDNPILAKGITCTLDKCNDEVLFTFLGTAVDVSLVATTAYSVDDLVYVPENASYYTVHTPFVTSGSSDINVLIAELAGNAVRERDFVNGYTLSIDTMGDAYGTFYSAAPPIYIENDNILLSPSPEDREDIYTHNIGDFGKIYDNVTECYVEVVVNSDADINKIIRFVEFNSIVRDTDKTEDDAQTITAFEVSNSYQTTGKILLSSGRIKRKWRKWRLKLPRDVNSPNGKARMRDTYFKLKLYFDNTYNKEIILNRLISHYDIQQH